MAPRTIRRCLRRPLLTPCKKSNLLAAFDSFTVRSILIANKLTLSLVLPALSPSPQLLSAGSGSAPARASPSAPQESMAAITRGLLDSWSTNCTNNLHLLNGVPGGVIALPNGELEHVASGIYWSSHDVASVMRFGDRAVRQRSGAVSLARGIVSGTFYCSGAMICGRSPLVAQNPQWNISASAHAGACNCVARPGSQHTACAPGDCARFSGANMPSADVWGSFDPHDVRHSHSCPSSGARRRSEQQ
jgi:hypothetical protein